MPYPHRQHSSWTRIKSSDKKISPKVSKTLDVDPNVYCCNICLLLNGAKKNKLGQLKNSLFFPYH